MFQLDNKNYYGPNHIMKVHVFYGKFEVQKGENKMYLL